MHLSAGRHRWRLWARARGQVRVSYRRESQPRLPGDNRIRAAAAFLIVVFVLVAVVPSAIFLRLRGTEDRLLDQTDRLSLSSTQILALMTYQETGERGYLLTSDPSFLSPYESGRAQIDAAFGQAATQAAALGGRAPSLLSDMRAAAAAWQSDVGDHVVALTQAGQVQEAVALETTGAGKVAFDRFRTTNGALSQYTAGVRGAQTRQRDRLLGLLSVVLAALGVLGVVGIVLLYYISIVSRGYLRRAERSEAVIRAKDEFLALASHELKTPLATIKGQAQASLRRMQRPHPPERDPERDEEIVPVNAGEYYRSIERLEAIQRQSGRMAHLVDEMVDASRIEGGQLRLQPRPLDLVSLARSVIEQLQPQERGHELRLRAAQPVLTVFADDGRIEQVLVNLLSNAVKFSPDGDAVEVDVRARGDVCVCAVTDRGIGIPRQEQRLLFGRFFRASNVSAGTISGLGVGLYISQAIVRGHGGQIWVDSTEGQGSTFSFTLPLVRPAGAGVTPAG